MNFSKERVEDYYLCNTAVENIFINEYMTDAPGDYVKVYLFALMYADYGIPMDNYNVAKQLGMAAEDVLKAWSYWEEKGVVNKHYENPEDRFNYRIEFVNLKQKNYCNQKKSEVTKINSETGKERLEDKEIKEMFNNIERITGRLFTGKEPMEIISWVENYGATPEVIVYAYEYTLKIKKHTSHKYVGAVVKEWTKRELRTKTQIEEYLSETDNRHYLYKRVLKALGFMRNPTEGEKAIMDTWFDELSLSIDRILEACSKTSGISNPNINYVNSVLRAWDKSVGGKGKGKSEGASEGKTNLITEVFKYYEDTRRENERLARERKEEVYKKIPRIRELDEEARDAGMEMSKLMLSPGYDAKAKLNSLKKKVSAINTEKAFMLTENNFNMDYMDIVYTCPICKDTGTQDTGERCSCFAAKLREIQKMS